MSDEICGFGQGLDYSCRSCARREAEISVFGLSFRVASVYCKKMLAFWFDGGVIDCILFLCKQFLRYGRKVAKRWYSELLKRQKPIALGEPLALET